MSTMEKRDVLIFIIFFPYSFYLRNVLGMFSFVAPTRKTVVLRNEYFSIRKYFPEKFYLEKSWK